MRIIKSLRTAAHSCASSVGVFIRDVGNGVLEIGHNALAFVGLAVVIVALFVFGRTDLRQQAETVALNWLQQRHEARAEASGDLLPALAEADAVTRATAANPGQLSRQQAAVANWIARRYGVAQEPVARLVQEAWAVGQRAKLDPTLILSVVAVESRFNPFAQSSVGAQGLMQVMTRIHSDKYEPFGGTHAAFDPVSNLKVGVQVLLDCIARAGSLQEGLRWYSGAANLPDDGGYISKVIGEQRNLQRVAKGQTVSPNVPASGQPTPSPRLAEASDAAATPAAPASAPEAQQLALLR